MPDRLASLSASRTSTRTDWNAGRSPKSTPAASATPNVKMTTRVSTTTASTRAEASIRRVARAGAPTVRVLKQAESDGKDADDRGRTPVEQHALTEHGAPAEPRLPHAVTQDHDRLATRFVFVGGKRAANLRSDAQHRQHVRAEHLGSDALRLVAATHVQSCCGTRRTPGATARRRTHRDSFPPDSESSGNCGGVCSLIMTTRSAS